MGRIPLLAGEAGFGKTRLLREFSQSLTGRALVLSGAGYAEAQANPYGPVVEAVRPSLRASRAWMDAPACYLAEAARLIPELRQVRLDLPDPLAIGPDEARAGLFEALAEIVLKLASVPLPMVLLLDDLHWADRTTCDWLASVAHRLRGSRLLVTARHNRDEGVDLADLRHSLARQGLLTELELPLLDPSAVGQIVQHVAAIPNVDLAKAGLTATAEPLARFRYETTGGNPFYLLETLRAYLDSACSVQHPARPAELCLLDSVRAAVAACLERLSPVARHVLEAGVVLGRSFAYDLVLQTAGWGEPETLDALEELVARRFLHEETGGYTFFHEMVRAIVVQVLGPNRSRLLHGRAAAGLERLAAGQPAALA